MAGREGGFLGCARGRGTPGEAPWPALVADGVTARGGTPGEAPRPAWMADGVVARGRLHFVMFLVSCLVCRL